MVLILAHFHALASFVFGVGLHPELDLQADTPLLEVPTVVTASGATMAVRQTEWLEETIRTYVEGGHVLVGPPCVWWCWLHSLRECWNSLQSKHENDDQRTSPQGTLLEQSGVVQHLLTTAVVAYDLAEDESLHYEPDVGLGNLWRQLFNASALPSWDPAWKESHQDFNVHEYKLFQTTVGLAWRS